MSEYDAEADMEILRMQEEALELRKQLSKQRLLRLRVQMKDRSDAAAAMAAAQTPTPIRKILADAAVKVKPEVDHALFGGYSDNDEIVILETKPVAAGHGRSTSQVCYERPTPS